MKNRITYVQLLESMREWSVLLYRLDIAGAQLNRVERTVWAATWQEAKTAIQAVLDGDPEFWEGWTFVVDSKPLDNKEAA